jgi:hypothetical protein
MWRPSAIACRQPLETATCVTTGLDRLTTVTAASFGNASYAYNVLDNIVTASVGARRQSFEYDFNNRLTNVRDVGSGATVTPGLAMTARVS